MRVGHDDKGIQIGIQRTSTENCAWSPGFSRPGTRIVEGDGVFHAPAFRTVSPAKAGTPCQTQKDVPLLSESQTNETKDNENQIPSSDISQTKY